MRVGVLLQGSALEEREATLVPGAVPLRVEPAARGHVMGRVEGNRLFTGELRVDMLPGGPGDRWRIHSLAQILVEVIRAQGLTVLQVGSGGPVAASAAAEAAALTGLPLVAVLPEEGAGMARMGWVRTLATAATVGVCRTRVLARQAARSLPLAREPVVIPPHVDPSLARCRPSPLPLPSLVCPVEPSAAMLEAASGRVALIGPTNGVAGVVAVHTVDARERMRLARAARGVVVASWSARPEPLLEAMLSGRPVAASRVPGHEEFLEDGREGLLVDPGDARAWARALRSLEPAMARRAGRRVRSEFGPEAARRRWEELYRSL